MVDNTLLTYLINQDPILKFKYRGCFARDTFAILKPNEFAIVNTDPSSEAGDHWLLNSVEQRHNVAIRQFWKGLFKVFSGYLQESSSMEQALTPKRFSVHANVDALATF